MYVMSKTITSNQLLGEIGEAAERDTVIAPEASRVFAFGLLSPGGARVDFLFQSSRHCGLRSAARHAPGGRTQYRNDAVVGAEICYQRTIAGSARTGRCSEKVA
jgi:hypothetical protein